MSIPLIGPIIEAVGGLGKQWLSNKAAKSQAKHDASMKYVDKLAEWEATQADAAKTSWKDEWFALILSMPLIGAFIPPLVPYVHDGFQVLAGMPDYYKLFLSGAIAASFGIKTLAGVMRK